MTRGLCTGTLDSSASPASFARHAHKQRALMALAILTVFLLLIPCVFSDVSIANKYNGKSTYDMGPIDIETTLHKNGSMSTVEERTFYYTENGGIFRWTLPSNLTFDELSLDKSNCYVINDQGERYDFRESSDGTNLDDPLKHADYSFYVDVDGDNDGFCSVYFFIPDNLVYFTLHLEYSVKAQGGDYLTRYSDCTGLEWSPVGARWKHSAKGLTFRLILPASSKKKLLTPVGEVNETLDQAQVTHEDGKGDVLTFTLDVLKPHTAFTVEAAFDSSLVHAKKVLKRKHLDYFDSDYDGKVPPDTTSGPSDDEEANSSSYSSNSNILGALSTGIAIIVVVSPVAILPFLLCRKEIAQAFRSRRRKKHAKENPAPVSPLGVHPSVIAAVCAQNNNEEWFNKGLLVALLRLAKMKNVRLELAEGILSIRIDEERRGPKNPLDKAGFDFFRPFRHIAEGTKDANARSQISSIKPENTIVRKSKRKKRKVVKIELDKPYSAKNIKSWAHWHYNEYLDYCKCWEQSVKSSAVQEELLLDDKANRKARGLFRHFAMHAVFFACVLYTSRLPIFICVFVVSLLLACFAYWIRCRNTTLTDKGIALVSGCELFKKSMLEDKRAFFDEMSSEDKLDAIIAMVAMGVPVSELRLPIGDSLHEPLWELFSDENADGGMQSFKDVMTETYNEATEKHEKEEAENSKGSPVVIAGSGCSGGCSSGGCSSGSSCGGGCGGCGGGCGGCGGCGG